jgi:hypothetical protein
VGTRELDDLDDVLDGSHERDRGPLLVDRQQPPDLQQLSTPPDEAGELEREVSWPREPALGC